MNLNEKWFYMKNRETHGPFTLSEIRDLIQRGEIRAMDSVFHDSLGQWTPSGKAAALQSFFGAAAALPPSTAVPPLRRPVSPAPATSESYSPSNSSPNDAYNIPGPPPPLKSGLGSAISGTVPGINATASEAVLHRPDLNAPKSVTTSINASLTPQVNIFVPPTATANNLQSGTINYATQPTNHAAGASPMEKTAVKSAEKTASEEDQGELFDVDQEENSGAVLSSISNPVSEPVDSDVFKGLLDCLPAVFRSSFPTQFGDQIVRFFYDMGNWALLSGILLLVIQIVLETVQTNKFSFDRGGLLCCILSLYAAFWYVNCKLRYPIIRLNNLGEGYISSFAIPDALSVLFFIFGACGLVFFFSLGMAKTLPISIAVILGFELFIVFAFAAVIAANPIGMKMSVNRNLSISEDSVGIIQYFMKLGIRLCCGAYGISCMSCCVLILYIQCNLFFGKNPFGLLLLYIKCQQYSIELLCFASIPLISYLVFLFVGCFIDFAQRGIQNGRRG